MIWTSDSSSPNEHALEKAWSAVDEIYNSAGIPLDRQLRLTACVCDIISFVPVVRELHGKLKEHSARAMAQPRDQWFANADADSREHCFFTTALRRQSRHFIIWSGAFTMPRMPCSSTQQEVKPVGTRRLRTDSKILRANFERLLRNACRGSWIGFSTRAT